MARLIWEQRRAVGCCLALQFGLILIFMGLGGGNLQPLNGGITAPEKFHLLLGANADS
jgi:hypothetical protein